MRRHIGIGLLLLIGLGCRGPAAPSTPQPAPVPQATVSLPSTSEELDAAHTAGKLDLYEAGLQQLARSTDPTIRGTARARLGILYEEEKRYEEAASSLRSASNDLPEIAPYLGVHIVDDLMKLGRTGEALSIANQVLTLAPNTAAATDVTLVLPVLYERSADAAAATAALARANALAVDEFTESRLVTLADDLAALGRTDAANALRMRLLTTYARGRFTEKLYDQLTTATPSPLLSLDYDASVDLADRLGRVNRYDQALDLLRRIEARFPEQARSAQYRYVKLRSLFNSRNYGDATGISFSKDEPFYLAGELLRARAFWRNDQNRQFLDIVNRVVTEAPTSKEATEARVLLGKYYITDETSYDKATAYLSDAIKAGANGDQGENLWTLGWTYVVAQRYDDALRTFDQYLAAYPDADYTTNALFWTGLVQQRLGRSEQRDLALGRLIQQYPYAYYSYRAREVLGLKAAPTTSIDGATPFPDLSVAQPHETELRLGVVRKLLEIGLRSEAARELKSITASAPNDPVLAFRMAELYSDANEPLKAMGILQSRFREILRHGGSNVPERFWQLLYPRPYWKEIEAAGSRMKLEPYMIAAITRQESAFDPTVVSNAGAVGLMQIMPAELSRITADAGLAPATRQDLFDPARNTEVGAAEFTQKMARMNGNRTLAIASYNAGEEAVGRWLAKTPIDDIDFFIESIPFNETRLYVKNVTRNLYEYRRIYESTPGGAPQSQ